MFTSDEFKQWCDNLCLPENTIQLISRIRENDPSRRVGGGRKNVVGAYPSKKMGMSIQFESHKVELAGVYIKEHDNSVKEYYDQPPAIKLSYKSLNEKITGLYHTPDYFVLYKDRAGWEEWKTEEELCKLTQESPNRYALIDGSWHCPPGEVYASQFGLHYWLKSSKEINWTFQRNLIFLEDYLLDTSTTVSEETRNNVLSFLHNEPGILLIDLINESGVEPDAIYYMIARNLIYVDLDQEVLTEPEYARVYKDAESSLAMQTLFSNKKPPSLSSSSLNIAPSARILWDGQPWTILNIGDNQIFISSNDGTVNISKDQFYNMVQEHHIIGGDNEIIRETDSIIMSKISNADEQALCEANRRYEVILPLLEGKSVRDIGGIDVTDRTIRNWVREYKQAEILYGSGYIGLIPCINKRGNRHPHLPEETLSIINTFLDDNENATNQSVNVLYGKLEILCEEKGVICPSKKTFCKIINSRPKYQRLKKTEGSRAAYQQAPFYWTLDTTTPRHGERPFEIAHIDHTELDIQLVSSRTGKPLKKPWLTLMIDAFSRRVLAHYLTFDAPSYRSDMVVIRECVKRFNRLPQIIITDGGRDYKSIYYESLLASYGITKKQRPPHKARFGSVIERLFGTTLGQIVHNLKGNTKNMKNPRQVSSSFNPTKHATWTLSKLNELLEIYFYDFYDQREHSALCESPREAYERSIGVSGKRPYRLIPYDDKFYIMTLPSAKKNNGTAKVDSQRGIKVNNFYYYCDQFSRPSAEGARVAVRYDPSNMGVAYSYINGQWVKCLSEYYSILQNRSEKQIMIASEELKREKKANAAKSNISAKELAEFILYAEEKENELYEQLQMEEELRPQLHVINGYGQEDEEVRLEAARDPGFFTKLDFSLGEED